MTRTRLSSTTAIVLSLSLAVPMPVAAQEGATVGQCGDRLQFPCTVPGLGIVVQNQQELQALAQGGSIESQSGAGMTAVPEPAPIPEPTQPEVAAEPAPIPEPAQPEVVAEPVQPAAAPEPAQPEPIEAADEAPAPQAAEPAQTPVDAPQTDTLPEQAIQGESLENQAPAVSPPAPSAEPAPEPEKAAAPEAEIPAPAAQTEPEAPAAAAQPETVAPVVEQDQTQDAAQDATVPAPPRSESMENQVPQISAADQAAAADRAEEVTSDAAAGTGEVVETTTATVTEEEARSSGEEFDTSASGQPTPAAKRKDDKGEKVLKLLGTAAVAGLGAYAIGRMLDGGGKVVSNTGDRVVVEDDGQYFILKDDDTLLRRPGSEVATQTFSDGSTRTIVTARDGSETITIRAANGRVLSRTRLLQDGRRVVLFDDTRDVQRVDVSQLRPAKTQYYDYSTSDVDELRAALAASGGQLPDRRFSLNQIRRIDAVRKLVPVIALDAINFQTGSAVIRAEEAEALTELGNAMRRAIERDPDQVFLIEGHTDTVGAASYNLALSDRRAESVALALAEYFDVPPSNMIVQGYGEADLKIRQEGDIRANRRAAVRNITPLLRGPGN